MAFKTKEPKLVDALVELVKEDFEENDDVDGEASPGGDGAVENGDEEMEGGEKAEEEEEKEGADGDDEEDGSQSGGDSSDEEEEKAVPEAKEEQTSIIESLSAHFLFKNILTKETKQAAEGIDIGRLAFISCLFEPTLTRMYCSCLEPSLAPPLWTVLEEHIEDIKSNRGAFLLLMLLQHPATQSSVQQCLKSNEGVLTTLEDSPGKKALVKALQESQSTKGKSPGKKTRRNSTSK